MENRGKGDQFKQCEEVLRRYIPRAEWEARKAEMQEAREQREAAEKKTAEEQVKNGQMASTSNFERSKLK